MAGGAEMVPSLGDPIDPEMVVLIVDDHTENIRLLERALGRIVGLRLVSTTEPVDAIRIYEREAPDLVLLDLHMPEMDGLAVIEAFQRMTDPDDFVPWVVLTADVAPEARTAALRLGAHDYLLKPLDPTEVVLRVRNLLRARSLHVRVAASRAALAEELARREEAERAEQARRDALRDEIRHVLDDRLVDVVYQPIVDLRTGSVVGAEALSRFTSEPLRGPDRWFADAADVGLGEPLELLSIELAVAHVADLPDDAFLSVNLSPAALAQGIDLAARAHDGRRLVIELTEHAVILDYSVINAATAEYRAQGIRLAVDDAGAGFASLQHVLALSPDFIKLDIVLTRGIDSDPVRRALAAALVRFAREVGAELIAEGIETVGELATLQSLGVGLGQGYHLARPMALPLPEQVPAVLATQQA